MHPHWAPARTHGWQAETAPHVVNFILVTHQNRSITLGAATPCHPQLWVFFYPCIILLYVCFMVFQFRCFNVISIYSSDHSMDETIGMLQMISIWFAPTRIYSPLPCIECALFAWSCHQIKSDYRTCLLSCCALTWQSDAITYESKKLRVFFKECSHSITNILFEMPHWQGWKLRQETTLESILVWK